MPFFWVTYKAGIEIVLNGQYVLLRKNARGEMEVSQIQVVSPPVFSPQLKTTQFKVNVLSVNGVDLQPPQEQRVTLHDIGAVTDPKERIQLPCRTFPYHSNFYRALADDVCRQPEFWIDRFSEPEYSIKYKADQK